MNSNFSNKMNKMISIEGIREKSTRKINFIDKSKNNNQSGDGNEKQKVVKNFEI